MKESKSTKKVGVALGSGAARGLAHIGVLAVLEKEGIPIDMITGVSMGALIGALYAQEKDINRIRKLAMDWGAKRLTFLADPALSKTGLLRGRKIENTLRSILNNLEFKDLKLPFACVATDINSGEEVVIQQGLLWKAIRASASIPMIFTVVKWDGKYLVDGGLANPVPVSVLKTMGANFIIAVNVMPYPGMPGTKEPNIFNIIMHTVHIAGYRIIKSSLGGADIVIEPQLEHITFADFHRVEECIAQGERAAQRAIPEIKRYLAQG